VIGRAVILAPLLIVCLAWTPEARQTITRGTISKMKIDASKADYIIKNGSTEQIKTTSTGEITICGIPLANLTSVLASVETHVPISFTDREVERITTGELTPGIPAIYTTPETTGDRLRREALRADDRDRTARDVRDMRRRLEACIVNQK
jgi:hypothetical protein